jgi:hypothetical protein
VLVDHPCSAPALVTAVGLATQRHWLVVEPLPGYAHDLNPMEMV